MKWHDAVASVDGAPLAGVEAVVFDIGTLDAALDEASQTIARMVGLIVLRKRGAIRRARRKHRGRERREAMRLLRLMHQGGPRMRREGFAASKARIMVRTILAESTS